MANKVFYLEPDEEITKVIDRIRNSEENGVILVVPRGSTISQSIINLKLLKRSAAEHKKKIGLVTTDRVTNNLAEQLGVRVFSKASEAENDNLSYDEPETREEAESDDSSLKVHTYRKYDLSHLSIQADEENKSANEEALPEKDDSPEESFDDEEAEAAALPEEAPEKEESEIEEDEPPMEKKEIMPEEPKQEIHMPTRVQRQIKPSGSRKILLAMGGFVILVLVFTAYLYFSKAEASLVLTTTDMNREETFRIDKNQTAIDANALKIPGQIVEVQKEISKSFVPTGKKDVGEKAKGTITISNSVSTKSVPVSPGARVVAADGKVFTVDKGVMVPGATLKNCDITPSGYRCDTVSGTIDAEVTASANGEEYNLAPTTFTIGQLTAQNKAAFSGGVTKNILYVTEQDLSKAEEAIRKEASDQAKPELIAKAAEGSKQIFDKDIVLDILALEPSKHAEEEAESFEVKAKVKLSALGFTENDIRTAFVDLLSSNLQANQMLVGTEESTLSYQLSESAINDGYLLVKAEYKGKVGPKIEISNLQNNVRNKSYQGAIDYFRGIDGVTSVSLTIRPKFLNRTPQLSNKIKIDFTYEK